MGRYNKITNEIIKNTFCIIKESIGDDWKGEDIICDCITDYETPDMEFDVETVLRNSEVGRFKVEACVFDNEDDQIPIIFIQIDSNDFSNESMYSDIYYELRDVVRHEIEHLTQRGINQKCGKYMRDNQAVRLKIGKDELPLYRYYTLQDEVDANIQGLYSKSKSLKQPFQIVIDRYLDNLVNKKMINNTEREKIYKIWKKRIPKIGGIPKLK